MELWIDFGKRKKPATDPLFNQSHYRVSLPGSSVPVFDPVNRDNNRYMSIFRNDERTRLLSRELSFHTDWLQIQSFFHALWQDQKMFYSDLKMKIPGLFDHKVTNR